MCACVVSVKKKKLYIFKYITQNVNISASLSKYSDELSAVFYIPGIPSFYVYACHV